MPAGTRRLRDEALPDGLQGFIRFAIDAGMSPDLCACILALSESAGPDPPTPTAGPATATTSHATGLW